MIIISEAFKEKNENYSFTQNFFHISLSYIYVCVCVCVFVCAFKCVNSQINHISKYKQENGNIQLFFFLIQLWNIYLVHIII